jgi:hypothetical protein
MTAKMEHIPPVDSAKFQTDQVNRVIKNYESGHVSVQMVTTVVPDQRSQTGSRIIYEAFIILP